MIGFALQQGKSMKRLCLIAALIVFAAPLSATVLTEHYDVVFPVASGLYNAGDVVGVTVTYDDAGTAFHAWNDGLNTIGEAGQNDDTIHLTFTTAGLTAYSFLSDAAYTFTGLAPLPAGDIPYDGHSTNRSAVYAYGDPLSDGYTTFQLTADDLSIVLRIYGDQWSSYYPDGYTSFYIDQTYIDAQGAQDAVRSSFSYPFRVTPTEVPAPPPTALLGLGLAGLSCARGRKGHRTG